MSAFAVVVVIVLAVAVFELAVAAAPMTSRMFALPRLALIPVVGADRADGLLRARQGERLRRGLARCRDLVEGGEPDVHPVLERAAGGPPAGRGHSDTAADGDRRDEEVELAHSGGIREGDVGGACGAVVRDSGGVMGDGRVDTHGSRQLAVVDRQPQLPALAVEAGRPAGALGVTFRPRASRIWTGARTGPATRRGESLRKTTAPSSPTRGTREVSSCQRHVCWPCRRVTVRRTAPSARRRRPRRRYRSRRRHMPLSRRRAATPRDGARGRWSCRAGDSVAAGLKADAHTGGRRADERGAEASAAPSASVRKAAWSSERPSSVAPARRVAVDDSATTSARTRRRRSCPC